MEQTHSPPARSFAQDHADASLGFRAVPRWLRRSDFWQLLPAAHRSVLDELYHRMASIPLTQKGTGIKLSRGQWSMSWEQLAKASGASVTQARVAVGKAISAGILWQDVTTFRTATVTIQRCVFTWRDFNTYDMLTVENDKPTDKSPDRSTDKSNDKSTDSIKTPATTTPPKDTIDKTPLEDFPPAAVAVPSAPRVTADELRVADLEDDQQPQAKHDQQPAAQAHVNESPKAKRAKLTDDQKKLICSSKENMVRWIKFGLSGVEHPQAADAGQLPASATHWHRAAADPKVIDACASSKQLAGMWWAAVTTWRAATGQQLTIPDFGRVIKAIEHRQQTMTQDELVGLMRSIITNWQQITASLSWMRPALDEGTLFSQKVVNEVRHTAAPRPAPGQASRRTAEVRFANSYENNEQWTQDFLKSIAEN